MMNIFTFDQAFINIMNSVLLLSAFSAVSFYAGRLYERVRFSRSKYFINRMFKTFGESFQFKFTLDEKVGTEFANLMACLTRIFSSLDGDVLNTYIKTACAILPTLLERYRPSTAPTAPVAAATAPAPVAATAPALAATTLAALFSSAGLDDPVGLADLTDMIAEAKTTTSGTSVSDKDDSPHVAKRPRVESTVDSDQVPDFLVDVPVIKSKPNVKPSAPATTPPDSETDDDEVISSHGSDSGVRQRTIRIVRN